MRGGSLYRWSTQHGRGLRDDLLLAGAQESLRGIDVNRLIQQGLDHGIQSIDRKAVKRKLESDFKKGVRKELKRKPASLSREGPSNECETFSVKSCNV